MINVSSFIIFVKLRSRSILSLYFFNNRQDTSSEEFRRAPGTLCEARSGRQPDVDNGGRAGYAVER